MALLINFQTLVHARDHIRHIWTGFRTHSTNDCILQGDEDHAQKLKVVSVNVVWFEYIFYSIISKMGIYDLMDPGLAWMITTSVLHRWIILPSRQCWRCAIDNRTGQIASIKGRGGIHRDARSWDTAKRQNMFGNLSTPFPVIMVTGKNTGSVSLK